MIDKTGKMKDFIIEDKFIVDDNTGLKCLDENNIIVWADKGLIEILSKIKGITDVFNTGSDTKYSIYLDPRYDRNFIKKEIEAHILCCSLFSEVKFEEQLFLDTIQTRNSVL